jgi:transposase
VVLVEDECRIEREAGVTALWSLKGKPVVIHVDQEKEAVSFYGALNLKTGDCHVLSTEGRQNSVVTVRFLKTLEERYRGKKVLLIWDSAPSHFKEVKTYLRGKRNWQLEILPLPPYSPELNPQEHIWRKGRQLVTHNSEDDFSDRVRKFANFLISNTFKTGFLEKYTRKKHAET